MFSGRKAESSRTPASPAVAKNIVLFNVGGQRFEISARMLDQYPNTKMFELFKQASLSNNKEIFLDHNPAVFQVVLDYIRYGGKMYIPRSVCSDLVLLQLKEFGFEVPEKMEEDTGDSAPPLYSEAINSVIESPNSRSISKTIANVLEVKISTLIENYIYPLILDHANAGHVQIEIYLVDNKIRVNDIATTINDEIPVEWIFLTDKELEFESSVSSSSFQKSSASQSDMASIEDKLQSYISELSGISSVQKQKLYQLIEGTKKDKHKTKTSTTILPNVSYLLQPGVLTQLEKIVINRTSITKCQSERHDITVRRENEYGLLESTTIPAVRLKIKLV